MKSILEKMQSRMSKVPFHGSNKAGKRQSYPDVARGRTDLSGLSGISRKKLNAQDCMTKCNAVMRCEKTRSLVEANELVRDFNSIETLTIAKLSNDSKLDGPQKSKICVAIPDV